MSGAAVRISPLGRWTESAMVVNRTSALIDTRGTIPAPRSLGNTFGVEFGVVQRGDGLLEDLSLRSVVGVRGIAPSAEIQAPSGTVHPEALTPDQVIKMVRDQDVERLAPHFHGLQR